MSAGWDGVFTSSTGGMLTALTDQLHNGSAGSGAALAAVAVLALVGSLTAVGWLVLRVILISGLVVWVPVCAVLAISPRIAGALRKLGEFLASIVLAKLVMVITLASGASYVVAGVGEQNWMHTLTGVGLLILAGVEPFLVIGFLGWMQSYMVASGGRMGRGVPRRALAMGGDAAHGAYNGVDWAIRHTRQFDADMTAEQHRRGRDAPGGGTGRPRMGGDGPPRGGPPTPGRTPGGPPRLREGRAARDAGRDAAAALPGRQRPHRWRALSAAP